MACVVRAGGVDTERQEGLGDPSEHEERGVVLDDVRSDHLVHDLARHELRRAGVDGAPQTFQLDVSKGTVRRSNRPSVKAATVSPARGDG